MVADWFFGVCFTNGEKQWDHWHCLLLMRYWQVKIEYYQGKQLGELLDEDPSLMSKRQDLAKRLELYKGARDEIDSVAWVRW